MDYTKCKACGTRTYGYDLCPSCWSEYKKNTLRVVHTRKGWVKLKDDEYAEPDDFTYAVRDRLETITERIYECVISDVLPEGFHLYPQVGLTSIIEKLPDDTGKRQNVGELHMTVDFLITNAEGAPVLIVEINDGSHNLPERRSRDIKLERICRDAGIRLREIYTSAKEDEKAIQDKILQDLICPSPQRVPWNYKIQQIAKPEIEPQKEFAEEKNVAAPARKDAVDQTKRKMALLPKKNRGIALLLCIFLGILGGHSIYAAKLEEAVRYWVLDLLFVLGSTKVLPPIFQIVSGCLIELFWVIDVVKLIAGTYKDGHGRRVNPYY